MPRSIHRTIAIGPASLDLSIVVPVKDEAPNVIHLADEIDAALTGEMLAWECVWVDDGSTDGTTDLLRRLARTREPHRVLILDRNYGQSAALAEGFSRSRGRWLAMLDGDGQNDPADLPALIAKIRESGADMVNGYRATRRDNWLRKISSRIANGTRNRLTRESIRDVGCSLRILKRECVADLLVYKGMHRFLPTLVRLKGYTHIAEVPVNHRPRERGTAKYGVSNRLFVGLMDCYAVWWMQRRLVASAVAEEVNQGGTGDEQHSMGHNRLSGTGDVLGPVPSAVDRE